MARSTAENIEILKSINFEDSNLFGLAIDIFKVRLLITCVESQLEPFGFGANCDLCFDFRHINSLILSIHKGLLGPPYLEDGELSAISFADFEISTLDLRWVGRGVPPSYNPKERTPLDEYEINLPFASNGSITFRFSDLRVDTFDAESLDR
jgi:hypothetical protein